MAETVSLRNITDQALSVGRPEDLGGQLVEPDCLIEIPARLLHHQQACTAAECPGCLQWPAATWRLEGEDPTEVEE